MGPVKIYLNDHGIELEAFPLEPGKIAELIQLVDEGKLNFSIASTEDIWSPAHSSKG
jgi:aspartyl-tRNA(Asn)/glutamyl-tRNA(Gln) amidotransferase subunit B